MLTESLQLRGVGGNVDEHKIVHRIGDKLGVIHVRVVVVAIIRHLELAHHATILVHKAYLGNVVRTVVVHRDRLGLVGGYRAVVTSAAVVVEYQTVAGPELVTDAVLLLLHVAGL